MEYNVYFYVEENGSMPTKSFDDDAGWDLYATHSLTLFPKTGAVIDIGVRIAKIETLSKNRLVGIIKSRSGWGIKHGLECSNAGVIDNGYRGSIKVKLYNQSNEIINIRKGDRVAQLIFLELPRINIFKIEDEKLIEQTERNIKGLGSSGK